MDSFGIEGDRNPALDSAAGSEQGFRITGRTAETDSSILVVRGAGQREKTDAEHEPGPAGKSGL
jgi:hypothetical protein